MGDRVWGKSLGDRVGVWGWGIGLDRVGESDWGDGVWKMEFGRWSLGDGVWEMGFGRWGLGDGVMDGVGWRVSDVA